MKRFSIALTLALLACSSDPRVEQVYWREFEERRLALRSDVAVVYVWAEWSRRSVELLPSIVELGREYEAAGAVVVLVRLDGVAGPVTGADAQYSLTDGVERAMSRLGLADLPAAAVYDSEGELRYRLESSPENPLTPADIADAIESLIQ